MLLRLGEAPLPAGRFLRMGFPHREPFFAVPNGAAFLLFEVQVSGPIAEARSCSAARRFPSEKTRTGRPETSTVNSAIWAPLPRSCRGSCDALRVGG